MKKLTILFMFLIVSCSSLTRYEKEELAALKYERDITVENPQTNKWEPPKNPVAAACLNLLPGVGNFYLCSDDNDHCIYGALNLLTWPFSILWAVPDGAISSNTINERDLLLFYKHHPSNK
jgi:hypothetical protein